MYLYVGSAPSSPLALSSIHMELLRFLFLLVLVIMFPVAPSQDHCPCSRCGNSTFQIRYPFQLQGQVFPNCIYTSLKCNGIENIATLELPFSGNFYIRDINYDSSTIRLYDPDYCLPRRLMNLSLEDSPFVAKDYQSFTFYNCPSEAVKANFTAIECLSNSTNAVVAIPSGSVMEEFYSCSSICTSLVPLSWSRSYDFVRNNNVDLVLKWFVSDCRDCPRERDGGRLRVVAFFVGFILMIPAIVLLLMVLLVCCGCCVHTIENHTREREYARANQTVMDRIRTISTTFGATTPTGMDGSRIKSCSELIVVDFDENRSVIPGRVDEKYSCSICLEEYGVKEKVRMINLCHHCFHANCIDQWLQKNSTCPICRVSL